MEGRTSCLPPEILYHLFTYCSASVLARCEMVCHEWQRVAEDNILWKTLYFNDLLLPGISHSASPSKNEAKSSLSLLKPKKRRKEEKRMLKDQEKEIEARLKDQFHTTDASGELIWKEVYKQSFLRFKDEKVYTSRRFIFSPPSRYYLESLKDPVTISPDDTLATVCALFLPTSMNPFHFTPYYYRTFRPYHPDSGHLHYWNPMNYLRVANCFFFHPHWFWFYFFPAHKGCFEVSRTIFILGLLLLTYTISPFLVISLAHSLRFTDRHFVPTLSSFLSLSDGAGSGSWPWPLRIAICSAVEAPLGALFVLIYDSPNNFKGTSWMEHFFLKALYFSITLASTVCYYLLTMGFLYVMFRIIILVVVSVFMGVAWSKTDEYIATLNANKLLKVTRLLIIAISVFVGLLYLNLVAIALPVPLFFISAILTGMNADALRVSATHKDIRWQGAKPVECRIHRTVCLLNLYLLANLIIAHTVICYYSFINP